MYMSKVHGFSTSKVISSMMKIIQYVMEEIIEFLFAKISRLVSSLLFHFSLHQWLQWRMPPYLTGLSFLVGCQ